MTEQMPSIIYIDASLLIVDKPAGVLSIPDGYDRMVPYVARILEPLYGRLWVVHRLDKNTSGVMVFARNAEGHSNLNTQFAEHQVSKIYHALIKASPNWEERMVDLPLRTNVGRRNRTAVDIARGKDARTKFKVLERYPGHTLLEARPESGRRHQIRAHLYDLGFAIMSDPLYGVGDVSPLISRLALHAKSISFCHPTTETLRTFEASYPQDFAQAVNQLRQMA